jgi:hypothetical protein
MNDRHNPMADLARRVRQGDAAAGKQLLHELEDYMVPIVRRALRHGSERNALDRRIFTEARRVELNVRDLRDPEEFIRRVVDGVCNSVMAQLQAPHDEDFNNEETYGDPVNPATLLT